MSGGWCSGDRADRRPLDYLPFPYRNLRASRGRSAYECEGSGGPAAMHCSPGDRLPHPGKLDDDCGDVPGVVVAAVVASLQ